MRNTIGFFLGFIGSQAAWGLAVRHAAGGASGQVTLSFILLDVVLVLVACAAFMTAAVLAARLREMRITLGQVALSLIAGATTSTLTAPPSALVPRIFPGDGQFVVDIIAAAILSAAFGWIVTTVFSQPVARGDAEASPAP